jgi:hypothetical protein
MRRGTAPANAEADYNKKKWTNKKSLRIRAFLKPMIVCLQLLQAFSDFFIGLFF